MDFGLGSIVELGARMWAGMGGAPGAATVLGGIVTGIGGIWGAAAVMSNHMRKRAEARDNDLQVRQVTDENDPDLTAIERLQEAYFGDDVGGDTQQLERYVAESAEGRATGKSPPYFLAFVLRYRRVACGYLTAQYFAEARTLFLWYVAVELDELRRHHEQDEIGWNPDKVAFAGSQKLISAMLAAADSTGAPWQHIVTEIVTDQDGKLRLFRRAARTLSKARRRENIELLQLPVHYAEPVLRLDRMGPEGQGKPARLLYAANGPVDGLRRAEDGSYVMDKWLATRLLDTVLLGSYAQVFPGSPEYREYCNNALRNYLAQLPERLDLLPIGPAAVNPQPAHARA